MYLNFKNNLLLAILHKNIFLIVIDLIKKIFLFIRQNILKPNYLFLRECMSHLPLGTTRRVVTVDYLHILSVQLFPNGNLADTFLWSNFW